MTIPKGMERFAAPTESITVVSRASGPRILLTPEAIAAGRARVAAGESVDAVARDLAAQDRAIRVQAVKQTRNLSDYHLDHAAAIKAWDTRGRGRDSDELRAIMTTRVGEAQGSNPGGSYRAADGSMWYVKQYRDPTQAYSEQAANELYHALGLGGSKSVVGDVDGRTVYARQWMEGETLANVDLTRDVASRIIDGFAADAFTGNWDAVGTGFDNVLVHDDGSVSRIDNGGTFLHRAQGSLKDPQFLPNVGEWETLTDRSKAPYYAQVFRAAGYKKADDLGERGVGQIDRILAVRKQHGGWAGFVDRAIGNAPAEYRKKLADTLELRTAGLERIRQRLTGVRHHLSTTIDLYGNRDAALKAWERRGRARHDDDDSPSNPRDFKSWEHEEERQPRPDVIYVKKAKDAIPLILAGKTVELKNARKVNTVLTKLAAMAQDAMDRGEAAPNYDLCKVMVKGVSFFCESRLRTTEHPEGLPRVVMPQLGGAPVEGTMAARLPRDDKGGVDAGPEFIDHLKRAGISAKTEMVSAASLMASQSELVGWKVAKHVIKAKYTPKTIFVSRDNYVIDGHHAWAAQVARDAKDGQLGDLQMRVVRVDLPITEALHRANRWAKKFGIQQKAAGPKKAKALSTDLALFTVDDAADHHGLLVSLVLQPEAANALAVEGGEDPAEMHITLCYCGDVETLGDITVARAVIAVHDVAAQAAPLNGATTGLGRFPASASSDGQDVIIAEVDVPGLVELRQRLFAALVEAGAPPRTTFDYHPHITLAYVPVGDPAPLEALAPVPLAFEAVTISVGDQAAALPLGESAANLHATIVALVADQRQRVADTRQRVDLVGNSEAAKKAWDKRGRNPDDARTFHGDEGYDWSERPELVAYAANLPMKDRQAIDSYAGFSYSDVNSRLRGTFTPRQVDEYVRPATAEEIATYRSSFKSRPTEYDEADPTNKVADGRIVHNVFTVDPQGNKVEWSIQRAAPDHARMRDLEQMTDQINESIAERGYVLPEAMAVNRAAYIPGMSMDDLRAKEGDVLEEKGFTSTMIGDPSGRLDAYVRNGKAESIYKRTGGKKVDADEVGVAMRVQIILPPGTKVAAVEPIRRTETHYARGEDGLRDYSKPTGTTFNADKNARREAEILLGSGAKFHVVSVTNGKPIPPSSDGSMKGFDVADVVLSYIGGGSSEGS
jgi:2'-5' RNA ligase